MGLYDGYGVDFNYCSIVVMVKQFGCLVILLVDGKVVLMLFVVIVMGFQYFDLIFNFVGVIVNCVISDVYYQFFKNVIEYYCLLLVLGYVFFCDGVVLFECYLGLIIVREFFVNQ